MKKVLMALLAAAVVVAAVAGAASCEKYVLPELSVSPDTLAVNNAAQELSIVVNANVPWEFNMDDFRESWFTVDPEWGDLGLKVTVSIQENTSGATRRLTVPVESQTLSKKLVIIQSADENKPEI